MDEPLNFKQPAWTPESGQPYPGAEHVAAQVAKDEETAQILAQATHEKAKILARRKGIADADAEEQAARRPALLSAADVEDQRTVWVWKGRIPRGEVCLVAGRGGVGKSTVVNQLGAYLTVGDLKGEYYGLPQHIIMVINEDSLARTVVPRLKAAGADMHRVHFMKMQTAEGKIDRINLAHDLMHVANAIRQLQAPMVIFDPLASNLGGKRNDADEIRPTLEQLRAMAGREKTCVVGLAHLRKAQSSDIMQGILGSSELGNVARSIIGVVHDPNEDGAIILAQEKNNLGRTDIESFRYRIHNFVYPARNGELIETSRIEWLEATDMKATDVMVEAQSGGLESRSILAEVTDFVRDLLTDEGGTMSRKDLVAKARAEGYKEMTVRRAADRLKLVSSRIPGQGAARFWSFPVAVPPQQSNDD